MLDPTDKDKKKDQDGDTFSITSVDKDKDKFTTQSNPAEDDDYFDIDKYRAAAQVAYDFGKLREQDRGDEVRKTAAQQDAFRKQDEARDAKQAAKAYKF
ncbi:MAG: hypothetical protein Tp158DCM1229571_9 [Prokaryotic dsDNA virus sp.]|nr:MAG: hypothetical protein Tp158DCM1229571_9 [Prokaryotic dsDNA virus sp.]|tara:strand:- start:69858 stop:70154 length:297 start_codon:yes stop_codon:yes gene_type:complete